MAEKWTPGPWEVRREPYGRGKTYVVMAGDKQIAALTTRNVTDNAALSNSHLIASAPDLAEALAKSERAIEVAVRAAIAEADFSDDEKAEIIAENVTLKTIRAALAKARGE